MEGKRTNKRKSEVNYNEVDYINAETELWEKSNMENLEKEDVVADEAKASYNSIRKLQSRISAKVIAHGPITGKRYEWERSGAIVEVDEEDVAGLLEKRIGDKTCCGSDPDNLKVFILVE